MINQLRAKVVGGLRAFHDDEEGNEVISSIAVGAVGVLLAAVIFSTMSGVIQGAGSSMFSSVLSGIGGAVGGYLGF